MQSYNEIYKAADQILTLFVKTKRLPESTIEISFNENKEFKEYWRSALNKVLSDEAIKADSLTGNYYALTDKGLNIIEKGYYEKEIERNNIKELESETKEVLESKKFNLDMANAERVFKSYPFTRFAAIFAFISALILLSLKLLEVFGILPLRK